jgi:hypothetical protein
MKIKTFFYSLLFTALLFNATAQTALPAGYVKASVSLANGTVVNGYIKDNIKKSAAITFIDNDGANKKVYDGSDIAALKTEAASFICINGDFFKTLCDGKLCFVQKQSNASGKPTYNGTEAIFNSGTEGKIGDYFIYSDKKLKLINKKTVDPFIANDLAGCTAAIEKASAVKKDISKIQEAVEIYNSYASK